MKNELALTSFKTRIRFVNDINSTLATDELVIAVAFCQGFERVTNFHDIHLTPGNKLPLISGRNIVMRFPTVNHLKFAAKTMWNTEFWLTLSVFGLGAALAGTMVWLEKQPKQELNPRLFPTTLFLLIGGAFVILSGIHLLNLIGLHTGRP